MTPNDPTPNDPTANFPLKALKEGTLRQMAADMNQAQAVAVALMPRFGLEITVSGQEFQVHVSELMTGHDIRLARDVAAGMIEALTRLVARIDEQVGPPGQPEGGSQA